VQRQRTGGGWAWNWCDAASPAWTPAQVESGIANGTETGVVKYAMTISEVNLNPKP
jgi:hypothetical protein